MAEVCSPPATTRSAISAAWPLLVLALLGGCASAGKFAALPQEERAEFDRCGPSIVERRCHDVDPTARAACLRIQSRAFARRRTDEKRRQWLETNGCPAALIAGDTQSAAMAKADEVPAAPAVSPAPAPEVVAATEAAAPTAEPAAAAVAVHAAAPAPAESTSGTEAASEAAPAPTVEPTQASAVVAAADPTVTDLLPAGASCRRSAECASDLCVRGSCLTLAQLAAAESCPATPARTAARPPAPPARAKKSDGASRASKAKPVVADGLSTPKPDRSDDAPTPKVATAKRAPAAKPRPAAAEAPAKSDASANSEARAAAPAHVNVALASAPVSGARHAPESGARAGLRQARMRTTAPSRGARVAASASASAVDTSSEPAEAPSSPPEPSSTAALPPLPRMPADRPPEEQLRESIVSHNADMKKCVERELKRVPTLRAKGTLTLDVDVRGRVASAAVTGNALAGTPLEGCLRTLAGRWRFPSAAQSYVIEAPIAVSGVEGAAP